MLTQPADCVVGKVFAQMIIVVATGGGGMPDVGRVAHKLRFPLRCFAAEKAVEILEAITRRPVIERSGGTRLLGRGIMPLPPSSGAVPVILENLGDGGAALRHNAHITIPIVCQLADLTVADTMGVATCQ